MSIADIDVNWNLPSIASAAGATSVKCISGQIHADCDQASLDAAIAAYDHAAYMAGIKVRAFTDLVQSHMDTTAQSLGYDDVFTAISYVTSTNATFSGEAVAFRDWRDDVWTICHALLSDWQAGGAEPTIEEVLTSLPAFSV